MKKLWIMLVLFFALAGCVSKTNTMLPEIVDNQKQRLEMVGQLSAGVDYALEQQKPQFASTLNDSVQVLAEKPTQAQVTEIKASVDAEQVPDSLETNINTLSEDTRKLDAAILARVGELETANAKLKAKNEAIQTELDAFDSPWYSIKHGVMTLVRRFLYWGVGFGIVFLLLRTFAGSNPLIGAVFSVFEHIAGAIFKGIAAVVPKAFSFAGHVKQELFDMRDSTLKKIIDEIQSADGKASIEELKAELAKSLDTSEKRLVTEIKETLGYK